MEQVHITKSKSILGITLMITALGLTACSSPEDPDIKVRQDMMKNYSDAMTVMGGMVKEPDTFDAAVFQEQADFLAKESKNPWSHFGDQKSIGNATEAVWTNADEFKAEGEKFQLVTAELNTVAQTATSVDDIKPAFGAVGSSCKSCHTEFQAKTDN